MKKFWAILLLAFLPGVVSAHAFGQKYTLPLPVWLYVYGGGLTIIVSFLLIGYFTSQSNTQFLEKTITLSQWKLFDFFTKKWTKIFFAGLGLLIFFVTIVAGFVGPQESTINFAPTLFWIVVMLGVTYLSGILGNFWPVVNPWKNLAKLMAKEKSFNYPKKLSYIPALGFYVFLIWLELLSNGAGVYPQSLSLYLILYTGLTIIGSLLFGVEDWFTYGDFFSVFFWLISKLAPITYKDGKLILRWPFAGLLDGSVESISLLCFIIFMLSSTAFDGFRETVRAAELVSRTSFIKPAELQQFLLMASIFLLFILVYLLAIWLMKWIVKGAMSVKRLSFDFAFSLIPIVLAYNLAHYYTLLLVQGQAILSLASDPFNLGWNLFGSRNQMIDVGIIGAKATWESEVAFILIGHIAAVYISHVIALRNFKSNKQAFVSQLPMLVVMVAYTMTGLWILSQPLTLGK